MRENGLERGKNGLRVIMMCEIPSNAILADEFLSTSTASRSARTT
jgi:pyruvate,water dikinase